MEAVLMAVLGLVLIVFNRLITQLLIHARPWLRTNNQRDRELIEILGRVWTVVWGIGFLTVGVGLLLHDR